MSSLRSTSVPTGFPVGLSNYTDYATQAAQNNNISPGFFLALLKNENPKGDPGAVLKGYTSLGHTDAEGLFQFEPGTAASYSVDGGTFNRLDPFQSIDVAAEYVAELVNKGIGKGDTVDQAYQQAGAAYGDTASNNPSARAFNNRLMTGLHMDTTNTGQLAQAGTSAVSNFAAGVQELTTNPGQFFGILGSTVTAGATGIATNPAGAAAMIGAKVTDGASTVAGAASETASSGLSALAAPLNAIGGFFTSLGSATLWERVALVVLGLALVIVALVGLNGKPLSAVASRLPPIIPV